MVVIFQVKSSQMASSIYR